MRKIINLVKCEFIKNYTWKKWLVVILFSIICVVIFSEVMLSFNYNQYNFSWIPKETDNLDYYQKEVKENPTLKNQFYVNYYEKQRIKYQNISDLNILNEENWKYKLISGIFKLEQELFIIDKLIENPNINLDDSISPELESQSRNYHLILSDVLEEWNYESNKLERLKEEKFKLKNEWELLLQENQYYKYLEYSMNVLNKNNKDEFYKKYYSYFEIIPKNDISIYQKMIDKKEEDEYSILSLNIHQYSQIVISPIVSKAEFSEWERSPYANYDSYVRVQKEFIKRQKLKKSILEYSIERNKKQDAIDIMDDDVYGYQYKTPKHLVNYIFHFSIIVMLIVTLTSSGIVSREHSKRTEKALLTSSLSRGKILFSKFLYLIIQSYILWILIFIIFFIYAGMRLGFEDLFASKLVYFNGNVHEVNYILWILKDMLAYGIPLIAMLSILLMLSTVTLSTIVTVGISSIGTVLSIFLWHFIYNYKLFFLAYTPVPYLDFLTVTNHSENYIKTLSVIDVRPGVGLFICILYIVICYAISYFVYTRRDVKN